MSEYLSRNQNLRVSYFYKYTNDIIGGIIGEDAFSIQSAHNLIHSNEFLLSNLTKNMSEVSAERMVQLCINLAIFAYQMLIPATSSWWSYFLTTKSGLKKVFQCVFENPLYGLLFFSAFYFQILTESDSQHFNDVASFLGLPLYTPFADYDYNEVVTDFIAYVSTSRFTASMIAALSTFFGDNYTIVAAYIAPTKTMLLDICNNKMVIDMITSKVLFIGMTTVLQKVLIDGFATTEKEVIALDGAATYITDRNRLDYRDPIIEESLKYATTHAHEIKKYVRQSTNPKRKRLIKERVEKATQLIDEKGNVVCLDKCERKIKTASGSYCNGKCGKTLFSDRNWCWVDKDKNKGGKYLPIYRGHSYDYCDPSNVSKTKKCFTGVKYGDCLVTE